MYNQIKGNPDKPVENIPLNNIPIASCDVPEASCECTCTYDNDINEQCIN